MKVFFSCCLLVFHIGFVGAQECIDLSGTWRVQLQAEEQGGGDGGESQMIELPGTTDEAKLGVKADGSDFGILTREYRFYGTAAYSKTIEIPSGWEGKRVFLELERVMWESRVLVDGKEVSVADSLNSPHVHDLGFLRPGSHELVIKVNNGLIHNIGDKGHAYTEYTQSIWNGVVGKIRLVPKSMIRFSSPKVWTKVSPVSLEIRDGVVNELSEDGAVVSINLCERVSGEVVHSEEIGLSVPQGQKEWRHMILPKGAIQLWDDADPSLYRLVLTIRRGDQVLDTWEEEIGFREISTSNSKILVNGKPVFLRGNLDCVHFPLTGYPSCKVEDWERIFRIYKDYGLNHVRFHSWCPPKAAFVAADRVGIYIQAESIWIDWWMTSPPADRPEMRTKGLPEGLGKNPSADAFTQQELRRMIESYGNHASFVMMCIGNELGNSDFDVMESWLKPHKENDPRRLYSVSSARKVMPLDQYMATHHLPGIGNTRGLRGGASTDWDFEDVYSQSAIPVIAHEIGQWPVYPRWSEIEKYTGVLKARNLEEFRQTAIRNHIEGQNDEFVRSSGALNQIMYKYEMESFLRTPSCAGIQLLSMQDYQGQGEALVGWLDVFYDNKGITSPARFSEHSSSTVCLLRIPKFVWTGDETFHAGIQLAHYGTRDLETCLRWSIADRSGRILASGKTETQLFKPGTSVIAGDMSFPLDQIRKPKQLTVKLALEDGSHPNEWSIWVYPQQANLDAGDIYVATRFDAECREKLKEGGKVLLVASGLGNDKTSDKMHFYPLYWSLTFFPGQGKNHIGLVVDDSHPAFGEFPTSFHSDWQWEKIYSGARAFYLNHFPASYKAIAQPVDDFHRNNKLGAIFEVKAGKGKLLVCGFDVKESDNPVAVQLKRSLMAYMGSDQFSPEYEVDEAVLAAMFPYVAQAENSLPPEFKDASFYVECGAGQKALNTNVPWKEDLDLLVEKGGYSYGMKGDGVWKDDKGHSWHGRKIEVEIQCPAGVIGTMYVFMHDWNQNGRAGMLNFEGREQSLGRHDGKGMWVKFHVMREDSNDGKLIFKADSTTSANLMISKIVFVEEK